jgi:hypothetical protein
MDTRRADLSSAVEASSSSAIIPAEDTRMDLLLIWLFLVVFLFGLAAVVAYVSLKLIISALFGK